MTADERLNSGEEQVLAEHRQLYELIARLEASLTAAGQFAAAFGPLIRELEVQLVVHFEHEEQDGYFEEIAQHRPEMQFRVDRLSQQHPRMLEMVRNMQRTAGNDAADELRETFREFARLFEAHESEEHGLLADAFLRDIAAED